MTIYKGRIKCRDFASKLHEILTTEGYQEISSELVTDGRVYSTLGSDLKNPFFVNIKDEINNYLTVGVYEKYTPNPTQGIAGVFSNGYESGCIMWNSNVNHSRLEVDYIVNITLDRIIIFAEGMVAEPNSVSSLTYIGTPKRYSDQDIKGGSAAIAFTTRGSFNDPGAWRCLRDRGNNPISTYQQRFYRPNRAYGWGWKLFFSPIFITHPAEGPRGELEALYLVDTLHDDTEARHKDTFDRDGKKFMIIKPTNYGSSTLNPSYHYIMEV
jgi:hypothetical protein